MYYIVEKQSPYTRQMSIEDLLFGNVEKDSNIVDNKNCTRTYKTENVPLKLKESVDLYHLVYTLHEFNERHKDLSCGSRTGLAAALDRHSLYREFYIPKKSGGLRKIDAPNAELMTALRELKNIFEDDFGALYHTSAFAYIKGRSTMDALKRHQKNESRWYGKYDLSNFFGSTTLDFVMEMFEKIFPFSEVVKAKDVMHLQTGELMDGEEELRRALELAFLDGGLPQGTPLSPTITNIMMIPIDFKLCNEFRNHNKQYFVYTRYADDFLISSKYDFDFREVERTIEDCLREFNAPFSIKAQKTRYGSRNGSNWNLGLMVNANNEITIGRKKKKQLENMLSAYANDRIAGKYWELGDIQAMQGIYAYAKMVEGSTIDRIVEHIDKKKNSNILLWIKQDLKA